MHRWDIEVATPEGETRATYGSHIGGSDIDQRVHIPAQEMDCELSIRSQHRTSEGWADDQGTVDDDTPSQLQIGFCDTARPGARHDDVLLSFTFAPGARQDREDHRHGQGTEEIQSRGAQGAPGEA
jgi:hypothetical protein